MEERVNSDVCYRCKARGHWANNCPNTPKWPARQCPCGAGPCIVHTSRTQDNPNMDFYRCPAKNADDCGFFKWCDLANIDEPTCRCGVGKCSLLTVKKEGKNKGRKFSVCPKKRGEGDCGFFEWLDDTLKKANGCSKQGKHLASFRQTSDTGADSLLSNMMRELNVTSPTGLD